MMVNETFKLSFSSNSLDFDTNVQSEDVEINLSSSDQTYSPEYHSTVIITDGDGDLTEEEIKKAINEWLDKNPVEGVNSYPNLLLKPSINGVELLYNRTAAELGLQEAGNYVLREELKDIEVKLPDWIGEEKPQYTAEEVGADSAGTALAKVDLHNVSNIAHNDIRLLINGLTTRLNALADSDDTTLDQMSEIVTYIKSNKGLIDAITTSKVSLSDIIDNLTTNISDKPLSAAQGVALKSLIDNLQEAIDTLVIPTQLSELISDDAHRTVTDAEKETWNAKSDFNGDYSSLTNKPNLPASVVQIVNEFAISKSEKTIGDATTWTQQTSTTNQRERACVYGGGYYIVCGASGELTYSTDGVTWIEITPFTSNVITGVCYGKGIFLAVDSGGKLWKAASPTGIWIDSGVAVETIIEAICYANNRFIAVCDGGFVVLSDDGENWETLLTCTDKNLYGVCAGDGLFVAVGASGTIITSVDGNTWVDRTNPVVTVDLRCVGYGNGMFVAGGTSGVIESSPDTITWTVGTNNTTLTISYIRAIAYAYGKFYAVMYTSNGKGQIWVSEDAVTWTVQYDAAGRLWCATSSDKMVLASGDSGAIYTLNFDIEWLSEKPKLAEGEYLWQRSNVILSDGETITSEAYCASDDSVTADSIQVALGYTPANQSDLTALVGDTSVATQITNALTNHYTKTEIDNYEFITIADIDAICGGVTEGSLTQSDIDELMAQLQ